MMFSASDYVSSTEDATEEEGARVDPTPSHAGYLHRLGFFNDWPKRYMELKGNAIKGGLRKGGECTCNAQSLCNNQYEQQSFDKRHNILLQTTHNVLTQVTQPWKCT